MSVPVRDRSESPVEFLAVGAQIRVEVLSYCMKLPKRLTFFIGTDTMAHANAVAGETRAANSIYVTNRAEARERRLCLVRANNALQRLDGNLGTIRDYLMKNPEIFAEGMKAETDEQKREREKKIRKAKKRVDNATRKISSLINREAELIKGVKDSDHKRYKNLPE